MLATIFWLNPELFYRTNFVTFYRNDIGSRYLYKPFGFISDRKDFERFGQIIKDPALSARINSLRFETGTMDIYHMIEALGVLFCSEYNLPRIVPPPGNLTSEVSTSSSVMRHN
jgi:hypothetical protein